MPLSRKAAAYQSIQSRIPQSRATTRRRAAAEHPILLPVIAEYTLAFLPPSLMVRSTCAAFRAAVEKVHEPVSEQWATLAKDAVASTSLIPWAMQNGLRPEMARNACVRRGFVAGLQLYNPMCALPLIAEHAALAARGGHLPTLQWLRQSGCPWNRRVCSNAARHGHLAVLQWARAQGCA
eukprot:TRINITY_DN2954_c0_g1_i1.p1 TRINITY_DN2954_c0_g1~~TRINITY_DN2954_c0_g1_i1.p1  ORF type:complete len:180 (-),score=3.60 TRINITY_DN2954_c0_g1_i1:8-547(-)